MANPFQAPDTVRRVLKDYRRVAVVGLSPKPERPSHYVSVYMQQAGYKIIPVNPGHEEILGEKCFSSLSAIPEPPEVVDVFRRSQYVSEVVDGAIDVGAKAIWLQKGVIDAEAAERALDAGLLVVMDL